MLKQVLLACATAALCLPAHAECNEVFFSTLAKKYHAKESVNEEMGACKALPNNADLSVFVLPVERLRKNEVGYEYDVDVLLVRTSDSSVVSRVLHKNLFTSDTRYVAQFSVDTANYSLGSSIAGKAEGKRAFGVRLAISSRAPRNNYGTEEMMLYQRQGDKLVQLLPLFQTAATSGEEDAKNECFTDYAEVRRTLSMASTSSNGLADINVKQERSAQVASNGKAFPANSPCLKERGALLSPASFTLKFDGKRYVAPEGFGAIRFK